MKYLVKDVCVTAPSSLAFDFVISLKEYLLHISLKIATVISDMSIKVLHITRYMKGFCSALFHPCLCQMNRACRNRNGEGSAKKHLCETFLKSAWQFLTRLYFFLIWKTSPTLDSHFSIDQHVFKNLTQRLTKAIFLSQL